MRRAVLAVVLMLAATGAGIAAASAVVKRDAPFEQEPDRLLPGPAELMTGARAADPAGGPDWATRTYVSRTGLLCAERGRLSGDVFGDLDAEGRLEPRPGGPTGSCGDPGVDPVLAAVDRIAAREGRPAVTVVYGASLRRPREVVVTPEGGPPVSLPVGPRGAFIARFDGLRDPETLPLEVTLADGKVVRITWSGA